MSTNFANIQFPTSIPIAVGESLYSLSHFREYLVRGAAGIVQPDVARIGGDGQLAVGDLLIYD